MNYQDKLYSIYVSKNTAYLYGSKGLDAVRSQFPVWKSYFGKFLPEDGDARILDAGCGKGEFIYFLRSMGFKHIQGIDTSPEQIEEAKRLGVENVLQAEIVEFLSDKKEVYDVIFARDVIEHFEKGKILDILTLVHSALRPGGVFIIQTLNAGSPFGSKYRYGEFTHEISFTFASLQAVLAAVGFYGISFYPAGPVPKGIASTGRFLIWKIIETFLKLYLLVEVGDARGIFTQNMIALAKKHGG